MEGDETNKLIHLILSKNSKISRCFYDAIGLPHDKFYQCLASSFFVCRWNQNYKELWNDEDTNTDWFMHPKLFNKVMHKIDAYGKDEDYGSRFWEELQDAFKSTMCSEFYAIVQKWTIVLQSTLES